MSLIIYVCNLRHEKGDRPVLGGIMRSPHIQLLRRNQMNHKKSNNIMPQNKDFGANQKTTNQERFEENTPEQTDLTANEPQREQLKIMLVGSGSAKVVTSAIHYSHLKGYAQLGDWSRSIPNPNNPEEIIRILTCKVTLQ